MIAVVAGLAVITGIIGAGLVILFRRFGGKSWQLALFLLAGAGASTAVVAGARFSFAALLAAALFGLLFSRTAGGNNRSKRFPALLSLASAALVAALLLSKPVLEPETLPAGFAALGPAGYLAALYLILLSILALAALEQIVRTADERVRWEIKFLVLGLGASYAATIYVASKILLFPPRYGLLSTESLEVFSFVFPVSCALIFISWRRSSGRGVIGISQGLVYSSITLLAVGIYLIASSLMARWVSQWGEPGIQTEAVIFILSILALGIILLTTQFRHRARAWIRRHVFAGRYDYRHYWMEAADKVRSVDDPQAAAAALAWIVQNALGAVDVSVWLRSRNPDRLVMQASLGTAPQIEPEEYQGIVPKLLAAGDTLTRRELERTPERGDLLAFAQGTGAELLVPLVSSKRLVGLLAVGSNRSGEPFGSEEREFLRVLAGHAAGEFHKAELLDTLVAAREAQAFSSFATFVLHDLKNFATTLSMVAENAARYQDNPEFQRDAFGSVHDTAEKMKRLCNDLRFFSRAPAPNKLPMDFNDLVRSAARQFEAATARKLQVETGELPEVLADRDDIARVVQNLLLNAHQATPPEGTIRLRTCYHDGRVELSVADTGCGMTEEFLNNEAFLPFHTTKSDGLGIGLFQSKKIVEAHGGSIEIRSLVDKGTTVIVTIPAHGNNTERAGR